MFLVVSLGDTFDNFHLAFLFPVHNVHNVPEELWEAGTRTIRNVGITLVILD